MGYVILRSNGKFSGMYRDPTGKVRSAGAFTSKRLALRAAKAKEVDVHQGTWTNSNRGSMTLKEFTESVWWPSKVDIEDRTRSTYEDILRVHIYPTFGDMALSRITTEKIQAWVGKQSAIRSPGSLSKDAMLLRQILHRAVVTKRLIANPYLEIKLPKLVRRQPRIITPDEFEKLLREIPAKYQLTVLIAIETGMRWGEIAGLHVDDVDIANKKLWKRRVLVEPDKGEPYERDYNKVGETEVPLGISNDLTEALDKHIANLPADQESLLNLPNRNNFRNRVWNPAVKKVGLSGQDVTFHKLRAANATWSLAGGANIKDVMERLGHKNLRTAQKYQGRMPGVDQRVLQALENVRSARPKALDPDDA